MDTRSDQSQPASDARHAHHDRHGDHEHHEHHAPTPAVTEPASAAPQGTIYTCPMHPEIRRNAPGHCPICGMALEPLMPSLDDDENPELRDFTRRFWWTLPPTVVVLALAMAGHLLGWLSPRTQSWVELVLTAPVVLWGGWPFFVRMAQSIRNASPNMWTLIGLGVGAAFLYSVAATVAPGWFPESFMVHGRVAVYFEASWRCTSRPRPSSSRSRCSGRCSN